MIKQFKKYRWTNTLVTIILILAVALVGMTGCSMKEKDKTTPANDQTETNITVTPTPTPMITDTSELEGQTNDAVSDENSQATYYGDWTINKVLAYGQSGTYSKEDAEGLIGKAMSFSADSATCFGDQASYIDNTAKSPNYSATDYTGSDFVSYYRMSFDLLGLTGDTVTEISAKDSKGNGCTFLVKDENTLIVVGGGTYFELVRE